MNSSAVTAESDPAESALRAGLSWGVKGSFTRYVASMPDGRYGAGHGATETADGAFFFELDDASGYDPRAQEGLVKYRGDVRFKAHGGMLFVMIVDPWLEFHEDGVLLTVVDAERWPDRDHRITLATLRPDERGSRGLPPGWRCQEARLSAEGAAVFNDVYPVGEVLEPARYCTGVPTAAHDAESVTPPVAPGR
ncbi:MULTISPECIES: HtaA domain-containing protein [Citricoccus]|uniref:HtaA domain-containing protein n=1 Tax=Citricoccus TaxID=169133 RepID=UPI000255EE17|nr:HtaA domain-containing protein [Citricoccus sp. CH26A]